MKKILSLIALSIFTVVPMLAQSTEGTTLIEKGYEGSEWTQEDATHWGIPTIDSSIGTDVVEGYGLHTGPFDRKSYIRIAALASDTVKTVDPTRGILTVSAKWVSYGSIGREWFDDATTKALLNCAYFRIGNVYLMQNGQSRNLAYSTDGLATYNIFDIANMTGTNTAPWSARDTSIVNIPFICIEMQIDMPHNKLVYMTLSSETAPETVLWKIENVDIKCDDWSNLIIESGFHKSKSINGSPNEFLKCIKVVETSQEGDKATYAINYMLDGKQVNPTEEKQGFVGEAIEVPEVVWFTDATTGKNTKYYVKEPKAAVLTKMTSAGVENFSYDVRKANNYVCNVKTNFGKVLVNDTIVEGETAPWVYWYQYVKNDEDGCWYETVQPYGCQASNERDTSVVVNYTKSDITYFVDTEEMYVNQSHTGVTPPKMEGTRYSGGSTQRHLAYDPVWYAKEIIPDGGVFEAQIPWINGHTSDSYIELDTYADSICTDSLVFENGRIDKDYYTSDNSSTAFKCDARSSGIAVLKGFEVPVNSGIILQFFGSDNSNACLDLVTLKWLGHLKNSVNMTDNMVNYRTGQIREYDTSLRAFVCDKNYIFSESDELTAFYLKDIKLSEQKNAAGETEKALVAVFDTIKGAVPVGTLCVLSGEPGAIARIPYVNHSEFSFTPSTETVGTTEWTKQLQITENGAGITAGNSKVYALEMVDGVAKFVEVAKPASVGNGVAYYTIPQQVIDDNNVSSANIICSFNGSTSTGIKEIVNNNAANKGVTYNLNGQRINANVKGLVIRGGQKFFNK